jgi:hypothetical protein
VQLYGQGRYEEAIAFAQKVITLLKAKAKEEPSKRAKGKVEGAIATTYSRNDQESKASFGAGAAI